MAAEARAESPAAPAAPALPVVAAAAASPSPEKRALAGDAGKEERPEPKRRRACVAALDSLPCAAPPLAHGDGDGSSFSFQHARGGFVVLETTPKFGSFTPPAAAVGPKPAPPAGQGSPEEEDDDEGLPSREEAEGQDGNSQLVGPDGQGHKT
ncbi:atherin-like [Oryza brachyantha]|uniref:atherin-like n=1 Tax=Oryza brachyantha TaxID=4533 RepID=UPI001AD9EE60|nr:atherin-like [Oryza brachyantha]